MFEVAHEVIHLLGPVPQANALEEGLAAWFSTNYDCPTVPPPTKDLSFLETHHPRYAAAYAFEELIAELCAASAPPLEGPPSAPAASMRNAPGRTMRYQISASPFILQISGTRDNLVLFCNPAVRLMGHVAFWAKTGTRPSHRANVNPMKMPVGAPRLRNWACRTDRPCEMRTAVPVQQATEPKSLLPQ